MSDLIALRCTFRGDGHWCGRFPEDDIHVQPDERMRRGAHVWRHDDRDEQQRENAIRRLVEIAGLER